VKHLNLNNTLKKVEVLPYGVGERCGRGRLFAKAGHIQNSFSPETFGEDVETDTIDVSVVSLDAFCAERSTRPAWVKVDTEGWELPVLRGAKNCSRLIRRYDLSSRCILTHGSRRGMMRQCSGGSVPSILCGSSPCRIRAARSPNTGRC